MKMLDVTIQSYDCTAANYCLNNLAMNTSPLLVRFSAQLSPGSLILDSGCGPGRDAKKFTDLGHRVVGIDLSSELLTVAQQVSPQSQFYQMDMRRINFKSNHFDGIWALASLLHLPKRDILETLEEHYRVLRKEGPFILSMKMGEGEGLEADRRYGGLQKYYAYYQEQEIKEYLEKT